MIANGVQVDDLYEINFENDFLEGLKKFNKNKVCIPVGWWIQDEDKLKIVDLIKNFK